MSNLNGFETDTLTAKLTQAGGLILIDRQNTTLMIAPSDVGLLRRMLTERPKPKRGPQSQDLGDRVMLRLHRASSKGLSVHNIAELLRSSHDEVAHVLHLMLQEGRVFQTTHKAMNGRLVVYWHVRPAQE